MWPENAVRCVVATAETKCYTRRSQVTVVRARRLYVDLVFLGHKQSVDKQVESPMLYA